MKQIIDATKNPVRDEISVENSRKSVRIPSGMTCKNEDTTCHPFHITISQTTNIKQIIDATKNPVRDEISVENSRKSVRIPSVPH
ncbi:MAG: hypothetical protein LBK58_06070 [Prevotellaceae bacterium]|jgi:flagellar hook protein FlgE|nr:hypothetical protein [Prevotellaceae bacterium]